MTKTPSSLVLFVATSLEEPVQDIVGIGMQSQAWLRADPFHQVYRSRQDTSPKLPVGT